MSKVAVSDMANDAAKEVFGRKLSTALVQSYCVSCGSKKKVLKSRVSAESYASWKEDGLCPDCAKDLS